MSIRLASEVALVAVVMAVALMAVSLVLVKSLRHRRDTRGAVLLLEMRPRVLAGLDDEHAIVAEFQGRRGAMAQAIAISLLPSLRGADRQALSAILSAGGIVEQARAGLGSRSASRRQRSAELLGGAGITAATNDLIARLRDRDAEVRMTAACALGRIGDEAAVTPLLDALGARRVPANTVSLALLRIGVAGAPGLGVALESPVARTRSVAAELTGALGVTGAQARLEQMLDDDDSGVRTSAARAIGRLGVPSSAPILIEHLRRELTAPAAGRDDGAALAAIAALGQIADPSAVAVLESALARTHRLAFAAAEALALVAARPSGRRVRDGVGRDGVATAPFVEILIARSSQTAILAAA